MKLGGEGKGVDRAREGDRKEGRGMRVERIEEKKGREGEGEGRVCPLQIA